MDAYILRKKHSEFQGVSTVDLERKLNLLNILIRVFVKSPDDLDNFGELIQERARVEQELNSLLNPCPANDGICISPPWDEIGSTKANHAGVQNLKLELDFIRNGSIKVSKPKRGSIKISISEVLERAGIVPRRGFILCPFHNESNPSLKIYFHTNSFHCFGCGKTGKAEELASALGVLQ